MTNNIEYILSTDDINVDFRNVITYIITSQQDVITRITSEILLVILEQTALKKKTQCIQNN